MQVEWLCRRIDVSKLDEHLWDKDTVGFAGQLDFCCFFIERENDIKVLFEICCKYELQNQIPKTFSFSRIQRVDEIVLCLR